MKILIFDYNLSVCIEVPTENKSAVNPVMAFCRKALAIIQADVDYAYLVKYTSGTKTKTCHYWTCIGQYELTWNINDITYIKIKTEIVYILQTTNWDIICWIK